MTDSGWLSRSHAAASGAQRQRSAGWSRRGAQRGHTGACRGGGGTAHGRAQPVPGWCPRYTPGGVGGGGGCREVGGVCCFLLCVGAPGGRPPPQPPLRLLPTADRAVAYSYSYPSSQPLAAGTDVHIFCLLLLFLPLARPPVEFRQKTFTPSHAWKIPLRCPFSFELELVYICLPRTNAPSEAYLMQVIGNLPYIFSGVP